MIALLEKFVSRHVSHNSSQWVVFIIIDHDEHNNISISIKLRSYTNGVNLS